MPGTILGTLCLFPFVFTSLWGWYFMLPVLQVSKLRVTQSHKANSQTSSSEGIHAIKRSLTAICSHSPLPCPIVTHQVLLYLIIYICLTLQVHPSACTCTHTQLWAAWEQWNLCLIEPWPQPLPIITIVTVITIITSFFIINSLILTTLLSGRHHEHSNLTAGTGEVK